MLTNFAWHTIPIKKLLAILKMVFGMEKDLYSELKL